MTATEKLDVLVCVILHIQLTVGRAQEKATFVLDPVVRPKIRPVFVPPENYYNGRSMTAEQHLITDVDFLAINVTLRFSHGHGSDVGRGTA